MDDLVITFKNQPGITAYHIGTVVDVIKGQVAPHLKHAVFDASDYSYGFEIGSPKDFSSLGEALLVNNTLFATSTDKSKKDFGKLIAGDRFVTSGLFVLPKNALANYEVHLTSSQGLKLYDLYQAIYEKIKRPLAFTGFIEFSKFHANHIESAPVHGLNIFQNNQVYYTKPHIRKNHEYGFVVGALTDYNALNFEKLNHNLESVLYKNPNEATELLSFHSHVLTLESLCKQESQINQNRAQQVLHLFSDETCVKKAHLKIYIIDDVKEIK